MHWSLPREEWLPRQSGIRMKVQLHYLTPPLGLFPELSETSKPASPPVVIRTPAPVQRRSDVRPISRTEEIKPGLSRTAQDGRPAPSIEPVPTPGDSPLKSMQSTAATKGVDPTRTQIDGPIERMVQPKVDQEPVEPEGVSPEVVPDTASIEEPASQSGSESPKRADEIPLAAESTQALEAEQPRAEEHDQKHDQTTADLPLRAVQRKPDLVEAAREPIETSAGFIARTGGDTCRSVGGSCSSKRDA